MRILQADLKSMYFITKPIINDSLVWNRESGKVNKYCWIRILH